MSEDIKTVNQDQTVSEELKKVRKYNTENLRPFTDYTDEEHKASSRKGGINSGITKRRKKDMRELMKMLLENNYSENKARDIVGDLSLLEGDLSVANVLNLKMIQEAEEGNAKAFEIVRDTAGYKPAEQVQLDANIMTDQDKALLEKLAKREGIDPGNT